MTKNKELATRNPSTSTREAEDLRLKVGISYTWGAAILFGLTLPFLYMLWFWGKNDLPLDPTNVAAWGAFGDFVGGLLNPFVAFCALYWLTRSIQIQRDELSSTKEELAASKIAQQNQAITLDKQRFEDTFFSLLDQHNAVLNSFATPHVPQRYELNAAKVNRDIYNSGCDLREAKCRLENHDNLCGHYFRILYQLLKLVATRCPGSSLSGEFEANSIISSKASRDEKLYTNIVRSFLNVDVIQLLAFNCFADEDSTYWNYKCLIERYGFLEHMPFTCDDREYQAIEQTVDFYRREAFDKSEFLAERENQIAEAME